MAMAFPFEACITGTSKQLGGEVHVACSLPQQLSDPCVNAMPVFDAGIKTQWEAQEALDQESCCGRSEQTIALALLCHSNPQSS